MDLKQLECFVAVVNHGSFTAAAEHLYLSQPTVSAHIRALEEELGRRLLLRTTKSVELTPKGREVFDCAVKILALESHIRRTCGPDEGKIIRLGASTIPSAYILPQLLPEFGRLHPEVYFNVTQTNSQGVAQGLIDGVFDLGLMGMKGDERLTCLPFCEDRMVLIAPVTEKFLALQRAENPLPELLKSPMILREKGSGSLKTADRFLSALNLTEAQLTVAARVNDQEAIKNLVQSGIGVSFLSERAARAAVREKRLLQFELPFQSTRSLYLAYRREFILQPHIKAFCKFTVGESGQKALL